MYYIKQVQNGKIILLFCTIFSLLVKYSRIILEQILKLTNFNFYRLQ